MRSLLVLFAFRSEAFVHNFPSKHDDLLGNEEKPFLAQGSKLVLV